MRFLRQEYQSGLPFPSLGDLPNPEIKPTSPVSPALAGGFFTTEPPGKPTQQQDFYKSWWMNLCRDWGRHDADRPPSCSPALLVWPLSSLHPLSSASLSIAHGTHPEPDVKVRDIFDFFLTKSHPQRKLWAISFNSHKTQFIRYNYYFTSQIRKMKLSKIK